MSTTVDLGKVVAEGQSGYTFTFPTVTDAVWWTRGSNGTRACTFNLYQTSKYNVNPLDYRYMRYEFIPYIQITDETGNLAAYCTAPKSFVCSINEGAKTYQTPPMPYCVTLTNDTTVKVIDITVTKVTVTYSSTDKRTVVSVLYSYSVPQSNISFNVTGIVSTLTLYE